MATTTVDPYQVLKDSYDRRTAAIAEQTKIQEADRQKREQEAQNTLTNANRGVYTSFQKQVNPYGSFASQNNFSQGVTDYYKNASYGTMLQGLGTNQYNFNEAMNNSNSLWQSYLAEKAGQEADALNDYNSAVLAQKQEDERVQREKEAEEERIRQFNLNLQLEQEKMAEDKRRYDQEWAYQMSQANSSGSSGSGSGSRSSGGGDKIVFDNNGDPFTGWNEENGYAVEYVNGSKTGKKIKSNTSGASVNNTSKGSTRTSSSSKSSSTKNYTPTYNKKKSSGTYSARTFF